MKKSELRQIIKEEIQNIIENMFIDSEGNLIDKTDYEELYNEMSLKLNEYWEEYIEVGYKEFDEALIKAHEKLKNEYPEDYEGFENWLNKGSAF